MVCRFGWKIHFMTGYENLEVWQKSIALVTNVYQLVKLLPKEETYALSDQIRRSAISVPRVILRKGVLETQKKSSFSLYILH